MTDQPRDLAAEVEEISKLHDSGGCIPGVCVWHERLGTALDYIAALSRELGDTTRVLAISNSSLNREHNERLRLESELARLRAENERLQSELTALRRPVVQSEYVQRVVAYLNAQPSVHEPCKSHFDVLLSALDQAQRELSAVRAAANKQGDGDLAELERLRAEIARLSSPPQERKDIQERHSSRLDFLRTHGYPLSSDPPGSDIGTLLQDLRRYENAHGILMAERDEARGKVKQLEIELGHYHENTGLVPVHQRDTALSRIERLEGALRMVLLVLGVSDLGLTAEQQAQVDLALAAADGQQA